MNEGDKNIKKNHKIALALGSGGTKGFAHIGVLKALEEIGVKPDIITGSSMGAIIGACYALGNSVESMEKRATELTRNEILDIKFPNKYGFVKGDKAEKVIRSFLNAEDRNLKFADCQIPYGCVAADIEEAEIVNLTKGSLIPAVRASFSICGVFFPVQIGKRKLLDGGLLCRVPIRLAKNLGADVVIAIDCVGKTVKEDISGYKYLDTISRIFSIMDYEVSKQEMSEADLLIPLYQPNVSVFRVKNVSESIQIGYEETMKYKEVILALLDKE